VKILAVTNMYPEPDAPAQGVFIEQQVEGLRRIGVDVRVELLDRRRRGMAVYARAAETVARARVAYGPDLLHVMYGGVMAERVLARRWPLPAVVTFHGSDVFGEHLSGPVRRAVSLVGVLASWKAAHRADGVVAVSRVVADALPARLDRSKVRIIPCGIDLDRFVPVHRRRACERLRWAPERFHVLFPANTGDPVKRPDLARAAVDALRARGVDAEFHPLQGVPNHDVPLWMNGADVLLLTSRHEGSPTVVKEALACNLPVVSVDVGDVRERVEGLEGCHLSDARPDALADGLAAVAASGQRTSGRARAAELSHLAVARALARFYRELLDRCT
jgi:glycosyltransferase involved in cell wall biosynthesis